MNKSAMVAMCVVSWMSSAIALGGEDKTVSVWTIRATRKNNDISKELKPLAEALKKHFKFTGYKLVNQTVKAMPAKARASFKLTKGYRVDIERAGVKDGKIKLKIVVLQKQGKEHVKKLATTIAVRPGKHQLIGGWQLSDDDVLIIAVTGK